MSGVFEAVWLHHLTVHFVQNLRSRDRLQDVRCLWGSYDSTIYLCISFKLSEAATDSRLSVVCETVMTQLSNCLSLSVCQARRQTSGCQVFLRQLWLHHLTVLLFQTVRRRDRLQDVSEAVIVPPSNCPYLSNCQKQRHTPGCQVFVRQLWLHHLTVCLFQTVRRRDRLQDVRCLWGSYDSSI